MMEQRDALQRFGELILETIAAPALLYVGDTDEGFNLVRRAVGRHLAALSRAERAALAGTLNVSRRRFDEWIKAAATWDEDHPDDTPFRMNTRAGRIFMAALEYLEEAGEEFVPLGSIVVHVKKALRERVPTMEVWNQLEAYVALSILEHNPDDPEEYRIKVRPYWEGPKTDPEFVEKLVSMILPEVFHLTYQTFVGARGALARVLVYSVPESKVENFTRKQMELMRGVKDELDAYEEALQREDPDGKRVFVREVGRR